MKSAEANDMRRKVLLGDRVTAVPVRTASCPAPARITGRLVGVSAGLALVAAAVNYEVCGQWSVAAEPDTGERPLAYGGRAALTTQEPLWLEVTPKRLMLVLAAGLVVQLKRDVDSWRIKLFGERLPGTYDTKERAKEVAEAAAWARLSYAEGVLERARRYAAVAGCLRAL